MLSDRLVLMLSLVIVDIVARIEDILLWVGSSADLPESTPPAPAQLGEQAGAGQRPRRTP